MRPVAIAARFTRVWRRSCEGITVDPGVNNVVIKLFGPKQAAVRLTHHQFFIVAQVGWNARRIEIVGIFLAMGKNILKVVSKLLSDWS